jgi:hypothetical protein
MMIPARPDVGPVDRTKIQLELLAPLIKHLEAELGLERARQLVRDGIGNRFREMARQMAEMMPAAAMVGSTGTRLIFGDALKFDVVREDNEVVAYNVTECEFARFFHEIGDPELGFLLVCSADHAVADGAGVTLQRTSTLMQGHTHCDFHWVLQRKPV